MSSSTSIAIASDDNRNSDSDGGGSGNDEHKNADNASNTLENEASTSQQPLLTESERILRDALYTHLSDTVLEFKQRTQSVQETQMLLSNQLDVLQRGKWWRVFKLLSSLNIFFFSISPAFP